MHKHSINCLNVYGKILIITFVFCRLIVFTRQLEIKIRFLNYVVKYYDELFMSTGMQIKFNFWFQVIIIISTYLQCKLFANDEKSENNSD